MKPIKRISTLLWVIYISVQCADPSITAEPKDQAIHMDVSEHTNNSLRTQPGYTGHEVSMGTVTDNFGLTKETFYIDVDYPPQNPSGYVQLPSEYVLVGGGAETLDVDNAHGGAYLTESRPDWPNNRWYARSKDHKFVDPHKLRIYAIGIKINGISPATLRSYMTHVDATTSTPTNHPVATATLPAGYKVIGGGARANWSTYGSLLVYSYAAANGASWTARSKDHYYPEPCTITAWAIGIQPTIPGYGTLQFKWDGGTYSSTSTGYKQVLNSDVQYYIQTCVGASEYYSPSGPGRLIMTASPYSTDGSKAHSKDCQYPAAGYLNTISVGIYRSL